MDPLWSLLTMFTIKSIFVTKVIHLKKESRNLLARYGPFPPKLWKSLVTIFVGIFKKDGEVLDSSKEFSIFLKNWRFVFQTR